MVLLEELGGRICNSVEQMKSKRVIHKRDLEDCIADINRALLVGNIHLSLVNDMVNNIREAVKLNRHHSSGDFLGKIIERVVFNELCRILDAGNGNVPCFTPHKGKTSVVVFVGLQGSGKTSACGKYASYYKNKGFKPALVCADTFRADAFDQLKQNAFKVKIPYYGSYTESDPLKLAVEGIRSFKDATVTDLILIDTCGRHKQEAALSEETRLIVQATKPDLVVFVMNSTVGHAAFYQAQVFKQCVPEIGAVIVSKMDDGHSNGGGALSAVAATKNPVIFIGTGENMGDFEVFDVKRVVSSLLGSGDLSGTVDNTRIRDRVPFDGDKRLMLQKLSNREFTLGDMYKQFRVISMRPSSDFMGIFSIVSGLMPKGKEKDSQSSVKRYMNIMDAMTIEELDFSKAKLMNKSRILRIAYGSGCHVEDVMCLLAVYKRIHHLHKKLSRRMEALRYTRGMRLAV